MTPRFLKLLAFLPLFAAAQTKPIYVRTPDGPNIITDYNLKAAKYLIVPISTVSGIPGGSPDSAGYVRYNSSSQIFEGYFGTAKGWEPVGTGTIPTPTPTTISIISGTTATPYVISFTSTLYPNYELVRADGSRDWNTPVKYNGSTFTIAGDDNGSGKFADNYTFIIKP